MSTRNWHLLLSVSLFWAMVAFGAQCGHTDQQRAAAEDRATRAESEVRILRRQLASTHSDCDAQVHRLNEELADCDSNTAAMSVNVRALSNDVEALSDDLQRCRGIR